MRCPHCRRDRIHPSTYPSRSEVVRRPSPPRPVGRRESTAAGTEEKVVEAPGPEALLMTVFGSH